MDSLPRTPGIYKIVCVPTGKLYVGSAYDLHKRRRQHWADLRGNRHKSLHLQHAWNKYGENAFRFLIIELVMFVEDLPAREQYWLDTTRCYDHRLGFNTCSIPGATTGIKLSDDTRSKMRAMRAGRPKSAEHVRNQADSNASNWLIIRPDGEQIHIRNLNAFCREHGLDQARMIRIANGQKKCKTHFGYRCVRLSPKRVT